MNSTPNFPDATVDSIQIGQPKEFVDNDGRTWISSIEKRRVEGKVRVIENSLEGDQQADLKNHGGRDKAILAYSSDHFTAWKNELPEFGDVSNLAGAFGENLTITGLKETDICVGDVLQVGTSRLQVSQPRQPCWKLSRLWNIPKLASLVQKTGRTGWYLRVLHQGFVQAGDSVTLTKRQHPQWTVSAANRVMYARPPAARSDLDLVACESLSEAWKTQLSRRAARNS